MENWPQATLKREEDCPAGTGRICRIEFSLPLREVLASIQIV